MLEKWKQRAIDMNFKKAVILFVVASLVLSIAASVTLYSNFRDRITEWEKVVEIDREYGEQEKNYEEKDKSHFEDGEHEADFKEGDIALMAGCGIIGLVLGIWYWLLCMIWAYRKSYRMGVNSTVWVLATLFFHLAAIAVLYIYAFVKGTCTNCGRVRTGGGKFCDRCGTPLMKACPQCSQEVDAVSVYCSNCGKRLDENEK